jgi:hypothetical protein
MQVSSAIRISFVASLPTIGCAQDPSTQARKPKKIAADNRPRPVSGNKFKRFLKFAHLTNECSQDKHTTPFSSTIFGMTVYFIANNHLKPHYLLNGRADG